MHCLRTQTFTSDVTTNLHTLKTVDCAGHSCKIIGQFQKKKQQPNLATSLLSTHLSGLVCYQNMN